MSDEKQPLVPKGEHSDFDPTTASSSTDLPPSYDAASSSSTTTTSKPQPPHKAPTHPPNTQLATRPHHAPELVPSNMYPGIAGGSPPAYPSPADYYTHHPGPLYTVQANVPIMYQVSDGIVMVNVRESLRMYCPRCNANVQTSVRGRPGLKAWLSSGLLFLFCWPMAFVPLCSPGCQDQVHRCKTCSSVLAIVPA
ncbi:LITAF-like zinc ribbon domain-containing protein [Fimicolochytrium jonesii]|uniref:LITAF-like zinc ribbon domain-containing protein n=1 Tax=Fimicolochytrium jonesii TaxID=1396493 RepID=UPI0022FE909F|nr:LITAF-like zinc ribbon domain-containing protein [Fimicolochytrium jonesii]KAI8819012.1 LITAF-like zinc ribbon domain-containing protein [Fimicolochytrium jonesii]